MPRAFSDAPWRSRLGAIAAAVDGADRGIGDDGDQHSRTASGAPRFLSSATVTFSDRPSSGSTGAPLTVAPIDATMDESAIPGQIGDAIRSRPSHRDRYESASAGIRRQRPCLHELSSRWRLLLACIAMDRHQRAFPEYRSRSDRVETWRAHQRRFRALDERQDDAARRRAHGRDAKLHVVAVAEGADRNRRPRTWVRCVGCVETCRCRRRERQASSCWCSACHGVDGAGRAAADGIYLFPPLWGPQSFNVSAGGAARIGNAAHLGPNQHAGRRGEHAVAGRSASTSRRISRASRAARFRRASRTTGRTKPAKRMRLTDRDQRFDTLAAVIPSAGRRRLAARWALRIGAAETCDGKTVVPIS